MTHSQILSVIDSSAMDYCDYKADPYQMSQEDLLESIDINGFITRGLKMRVCDLPADEYIFIRDSLEEFFTDKLFEDPSVFAL